MEPTERIEIRLDSKRRERLRRIAEDRQTSASSAIRSLIDADFERLQTEKRRKALEAFGRLAIEDVADPETLKRQLEGAYDLPLLY